MVKVSVPHSQVCGATRTVRTWSAIREILDVRAPAPLMSTIQELGAFLKRETVAAGELRATAATPSTPNGARGSVVVE